MSFNWVASSTYSGVPMDAVIAGHDIDGSTIYVGRAYHDGDLIPAKVIPTKHAAYVPFNGAEIMKHDYQILCGTGFSWLSSADGHVPTGAVVAGNTSNGEQLFVGRANVGGSLMTGKIHPSHHCIYVPFDGTEHRLHQYEVLVASYYGQGQPIGQTIVQTIVQPSGQPMYGRRSIWVPSSIHSPLPDGAIQAGHDIDGSQIYIGRAWHEGDQIPAKIIPSRRAAYIAHGGREIMKDQYDVLCYGSVIWIKVYPSTRAVPPFSVQGGMTSGGEPLYIGRAYHNGSLTVGKVHISHGCLYIPFDGSEVGIHSEIEVLTEP